MKKIATLFMDSRIFTAFKILFALLLLLYAGTGMLNAQQLPTIIWDDLTPRQVPTPLVIMGDDGYLYINAKLKNDVSTDGPLNQPRITIGLPPGIDFAGTNLGTILTNSPELTPVNTFTCSPTTVSAATREIVLSCSHVMQLTDSLVLKVKIKAACNADVATPGQISVTFASGAGDVVLQYNRSFTAAYIRPTLRIRPTPPNNWTVNFANIKDTSRVSIDIDAQNGYAKSTLITLAYNGTIVYLDSFKLGNKVLPILGSNSGEGVFHSNRAAASAITYIRLGSVLLEGDITDIVRTITFRATANLGCNWEITPKIRNNLTTDCQTWEENKIVLQMPGMRGAPAFSALNTSEQVVVNTPNQPVIMRTIPRFNMSNFSDLTILPDPKALTNSNHFHYFCWDGVTPNYGTIAFKNTNGVEVTEFQFLTEMNHGENLSRCEYIDTAQIYYRVTVPSILTGLDSIVVPVTKIRNTDRDSKNQLCIVISNDYNAGTSASPTAAQLLVRNEYNSILWNKGRNVTLRLPGIGMENPLPAGAKIEFQWVVYANPKWINDAFRAVSSYSKIHASYNNISYRWSSMTANNICNDALSYAPNQYSMILYKPRFSAVALPSVSCYELTPFYYSNPVTTGGTGSNTTSANDPAAAAGPPAGIPTGARYAELFVKIPTWLNLDTLSQGISTAFTIRHADSVPGHVGTNGTRPTAGSGIYHGLEDGRKLYSIKYHTNISGVLDVRLIPDACTSEGIVTDTIQTWWDWISGTPETDCRPRFKKTSKVFSAVEFNCIPPALKIDTFGVYRITRGFKDVTNDHNPDDGTPALDHQIQHWHFLQGDTGYFFVKGFVAGSPSNVYDHLVLIHKYGTGGAVGATLQYKWGNTGHTVPLWNQATIEIKRTSSGTNYTFPLDIPVVSSQDSIVVYFRGKDMDYFPTGGDSCYLKIPFLCRLGVNNVNRGCFYVNSYGIKAATPTLWTNKYVPPGIYKIVVRDFTLTNRGINNSTLKTYTFNQSCDRSRINELYTYPYYSGTEVSNWLYEVRYRHKLEKIELRVPVGYVRTTPYIYVRPLQYYGPFPTFYNTTPTNAFPVIPDLAIEDFATQDSIFTIDMTQYYDYGYNGSQGLTLNAATGKLSNGLYPIGDDISGAYCYIDSLVATPASLRPDLTGTMYYTNSIGVAQTVNTQTVNLTYNGRKIYMDASSSVIVFSQMIWSTVDVKNSHGALTNNHTWLYVKGNVENVLLVNQNNLTDTIWGVGAHNCWLPIGTMAPSEENRYFLLYSYTGNDVCDNDTIVIYSVLDAADAGYIPDINLGIEQVPSCNRGPKKFTVLDLMTARIKIAGYITPQITNPIVADALHYKLGYAIDYVINGNVSQGALNDPTITFRIPAGQIYVDTIAQFGAASFEYPAGSGYRPMPPAILTALENEFGPSSSINTVRQFTIHAKDLLGLDVFMMPGWGYTPFGYTDKDRLFNVRIPLVPSCETDLTGIRFRAVFNGKNFCGEPCEDDGMQYISPTIYPDITPNYAFNVSMSHVRTSRVFTPDVTLDTLIVTIKKTRESLSAPININDYISLRMSDNMQIDGAVTCIPFDDFTITASGYVNSEGERIYQLSFPTDTLNKLIPSFQDTMIFEYRIPIVYNPDAIIDCSAPRQELECQVVSDAKFATDCGIFPFNLGSDAMQILTLNFENNFRACLNMPSPLTVACGGVTPVWFADEAGLGGYVEQGSTFIYTPTVQKDTSFWILCVYDFNGPEEENMGNAPVFVTMYDLVKADFELKSSCVGQPTLFENKSKIGTADSDITNTLSWLWYLNGSTTPFSTDREPAGTVLQNNDVVKLRVISIDGCVHDTSVVAHPDPLPIPTISGVLDTCWNECVVYKTQANMSNYQWTITNGTIQGADNRDSVTVCWDKVLISPTRGGLRVLYTDDKGCRSLSQDSVPVVVRTPPTMPVVTGDRVSCVRSEVTYKFTFQYNIGTYIWTVTGGEVIAGGNAANGGNGADSVRVRWTNLGPAEITLRVVNSIGCASDLAIISIDILGEVKAKFHADTVCAGETTTLTNLTTIDGLTPAEVDGSLWSWYLNNQTTPFAVTKNASRVFTNGDRVRLHVISPDGCVRDTTVVIAVHALPTPTVESGSLGICLEECSVYRTQTGQSNYSWSVTNGTINGVTNADSVKVCWDNTSGTGTLTVQYTDGNGCTNDGTQNVSVYAKPVPPTISGELNPCVNLSELYTYTTAAGMNTYQWYIEGGEIVGSATGNTVTVKWTSTGAGILAVSYKNANNCQSYPMVDTLKPNVKPNVLATQINAANETICIGNKVTLKATTAILNPIFQWYKTQTSTAPLFVGDEFETGIITTDTAFYVSMYGDGYCENLINTRKEVIVTVDALSNFGTTSNDTTICYNSAATLGIQAYTATAIRWQDSVSGGAFADISGETAAVLTTGNLQQTTWFRVIVTNGVCEPDTSGTITVTVLPQSDAGNSSNDTTVCYNTAATLSISGYTGAIRWQDSVSGGVYANMLGETAALLNTGNLQQTTWFRAVVTNGATCTPDIGAPIKVTVIPQSDAGNNSNDTTVCYNTAATLSISGYTGTIQWQDSVSGGAFADIAGETAAVLNTGNLQQTAWFRAVVTNGASCAQDTGAPITVTVIPQSDAGATSNDTTICYNSAATLSITGYTGNIQWQDSVSGGAFANIAGETAATLNTGNLQQTTWFRAVVTSGVSCASDIGAPIKVTVISQSSAGNNSNDTSVCYNTAATLSITGYTGAIQWQDSVSGGAFANIFGETSAVLNTGNLQQTTWFRVVATNGVSCGSDTGTPIQVTVSPQSNAGNFVSNDTTVCYNSAATLGIAGYTGAIQWQDSVSGGAFANIAGETAATLNTGNLQQTTWFRAVVTSGASCAPDISNLIKVTIKANAPASAITVNNETICYGTATNITATSAIINPIYRWYASPTATTYLHEGGTYNTGTLTTTTSYYVSVMGDEYCENIPANRAMVTITILRVMPAISIATITPTVCVGTSVTFTSSIANGGATPAYQWRVNASAVSGATGSQFTYVPNNGDIVTCVLTSNAFCANPASITSVGVPITVVNYPAVPMVITHTLPAYPGNTVDLMDAVVNPISGLTYTFYENPDKTGLTNRIVTYIFPKDDYYVTVGNGYCESNVSQIILKIPCPLTVTDIEGNVYKVTAVGGLCWTENLISRRYSSTGDLIPTASVYSCATCPEELDTIFGLLYDWYATMGESVTTTQIQGICPNGYHVPSQQEWSRLSRYNALQLMSATYWLEPPGSGTDDFGFKALPAGWFNGGAGRYNDLYGFAGWWASDDTGDVATATYFYINYFCKALQSDTHSKIDQRSVRCVWNN